MKRPWRCSPARPAVPARLAGAGRVLLIGFFVLFVLVPLYWVFVTSIKPSEDYLAVPPVWFPRQPTLNHYTAALFAYRGLDGADQQPHRLGQRDGAFGPARHRHGL